MIQAQPTQHKVLHIKIALHVTVFTSMYLYWITTWSGKKYT